MREGDRKRIGPADSNKNAEEGRHARVMLSLFGVMMLGVGLLVVFGGLGAGDGSGDGDDTATMAESNGTQTERNETEDTEEPKDNETETTEPKTETNAEMNETEANETEATEESAVNETPDTTGSDIGMIEPESEDSEPPAERKSGQELLGHL